MAYAGRPRRGGGARRPPRRGYRGASGRGRRRPRDDRDSYNDYGERRSFGYGRKRPKKNNNMLIFGGIGGAVLVIIIIAVAASGSRISADASTPTDACLSYLRALRAKDFDTVYSLMSSSSRADFEELIHNLDPEEKDGLCAQLGVTEAELERISGRHLFVSVMREGSGMMSAAGIFDIIGQFEVGDAQVSGSSATVKIYMKGSDEGVQVPLVWETGGWKVDE